MYIVLLQTVFTSDFMFQGQGGLSNIFGILKKKNVFFYYLIIYVICTKNYEIHNFY